MKINTNGNRQASIQPHTSIRLTENGKPNIQHYLELAQSLIKKLVSNSPSVVSLNVYIQKLKKKRARITVEGPESDYFKITIMRFLVDSGIPKELLKYIVASPGTVKNNYDRRAQERVNRMVRSRRNNLY